MTKDAADMLAEYKKFRDAAKAPGNLDAALHSFLRDVYRDALSRCRVRVIPSALDLMGEEPSGALSDFLCKYFERRVNHADNQTSDVQSRESR